MADVACPQENVRKVAVVVQGSTEGAMKNDADSMGDELGKAGFTVTRFSVGTHALQEIREFVRTVGAELGECDKFLLFISSHGDAAGVLYSPLGPKDPNALEWSYDDADELSISRVIGDNVKAGHINLVIDSCRAGAVSGPMLRVFSGAQDKAVSVLGKEVKIFTAASLARAAVAEAAIRGWEAGAYTKRLVVGLKERRENGELDKDGDGFVSVSEFESTFIPAELDAEVGAGEYAQGKGLLDPNATAVSLLSAVVLAQDLSTTDEELKAGATISLNSRDSRVIGGEPGQSALHCDGVLVLHAANPEGIKIQLFRDGVLKEFGPFPDPDPSNCGYGKIVARAVKIHPSR